MMGCRILGTCLNVKSFLFCTFGKLENEEIEITVCHDASLQRSSEQDSQGSIGGVWLK